MSPARDLAGADPTAALPLISAELPGCGGAPQRLDDFVVDEIPAYAPSGSGEHCLVRVRKRGMTTPEAVAALAGALGLDPRGVGQAGMKDKQGVTSQWLSFPGVRPEALLGLKLPHIEVLEAGLHGNKLRTGHLRGNRFSITLRGVRPGGEELARAVVQRLAEAGLPNYFGAQRFGNRGDNGDRGLGMLRGEQKAPGKGMLRRLLLSAGQSLLFNEVLARRVRGGTAGALLGGDVLQRADSGGVFVSDDAATDGPRLARGEVGVTGPIYGPRMIWPAEGGEAHALEAEVLRAHELQLEHFSRFKKLTRGGRRALLVRFGEENPLSLEALPGEPEALRLSFALPPGSYATVLLREVTKTLPDGATAG